MTGALNAVRKKWCVLCEEENRRDKLTNAEVLNAVCWKQQLPVPSHSKKKKKTQRTKNLPVPSTTFLLLSENRIQKRHVAPLAWWRHQCRIHCLSDDCHHPNKLLHPVAARQEMPSCFTPYFGHISKQTKTCNSGYQQQECVEEVSMSS